jgi:hypothetical protein
MKALISSVEQVQYFDGSAGYRVADVHETGFEVAEPLFWIDCEEGVVADQFYYDPSTQEILPVPLAPIITNTEGRADV